ncbi:MAG: VCBS repeat-containing protein, partial [Sediminibacterium sp.]|nr:VCBS repeat-containing protein [Sediminibacterium sp.]
LDVITVDMLPPDEKTLKTYGSDENPDIYKVKLERNGYQKQYSRNSLHKNNGNGVTFSEVGLMGGVSATDWSWAPLFADFDNDGNKDLFISSGIVKRPVDLDYVQFVSDMKSNKGLDITDKFDQEVIDKMPDGSSHPFMFKGDGLHGFTDVSKEWGTANMKGYYTGASYADFNNDGKLDVIINPINEKAVLLKNTSTDSSMAISLKGNTANTFGIGAKVYLFNQSKTQYQQLMLTRGFQSSTAPELHFGLPNGQLPDSILVVWPNNTFQLIKQNIGFGKMQIQQDDAKGAFNFSSFFQSSKNLLTNISKDVLVNWVHQENDFIDHNRQYLIPHQLSSRGPKIAVADINKDGLEDFFVCGASEQPNTILVQQANGNFEKMILPNSGMSLHAEKVDAVFFDANLDGYQDLYIVSGGNQYDNGNPALLDHFYLSNGKGGFVPSDHLIPKLAFNKSSVTTIDFDKDGDTDLFITGLADAAKYGIAQSSYLLVNNGKALFTVAPNSIINADNLGMATSSTSADVNNDGWSDLIIAGEWMKITLFQNQKGKFKKVTIPNSSGLWQTIVQTDVNNDGWIDFLVGNWGHNTKLSAGKNGP